MDGKTHGRTPLGGDIVSQSARVARRSLVLASCIFLSLLVLLAWFDRKAAGKIADAEFAQREAYSAGQRLVDALSTLGLHTNLAVETADPRRIERFEATLPRLDAAILAAEELASPATLAKFERRVRPFLDEHIAGEKRAILWARSGRRDLARNTIGGAWHAWSRQEVERGVSAFVEALRLEKAQELQALRTWFNRTHLAIVLGGGLITVLVSLAGSERAFRSQKRAEAELLRLAQTDVQAGLASRAHFDAVLQEALAGSAAHVCPSEDTLRSRGVLWVRAQIANLMHRSGRTADANGVASGKANKGEGEADLFSDRLRQRYRGSVMAETDTVTRPESLAVAVVHVGGLQAIYDRHGYGPGDAVLSALAQRMITHRNIKSACTASQESMMALLAVDNDEAWESALNDLIERLGEPVEAAGLTFLVRPLAGYVVARDAHDAQTARYRAALAMRAAMDEEPDGRRVVAFDEELLTLDAAKVDRRASLKQGLAAGDFFPVFQLIVDLHCGAIVGAEALARWRDPDGVVRSPADFVLDLDACGLLHDLTYAMLVQAMEAARMWPSDTYVSVNVPPPQLTVAFVDRLSGMVREAGFAPERLQLEVLETAMAAGDGAILDALHALRDKGFALALDDFGVEYSSFGQFTQLPISKVKIDRMFVNNLQPPQKPTRRLRRRGSQNVRAGVGDPVVRAICELAQQQGIEVIAEGIEEDWQREHVRALGCGFGQGYHLARPAQADELDFTQRFPSAPGTLAFAAPPTLQAAA